MQPRRSNPYTLRLSQADRQIQWPGANAVLTTVVDTLGIDPGRRDARARRLAYSVRLWWTRMDLDILLKIGSSAVDDLADPGAGRDQMLTSRGMPHACHDVRTIAVIGSHSKTPQTTSGLETPSRSRL